MKEEICILQQEIYRKLTENNNEVQTLKSDIVELEEWQLVANKNVATFGSHFASDFPTVTEIQQVLCCFRGCSFRIASDRTKHSQIIFEAWWEHLDHIESYTNI